MNISREFGRRVVAIGVFIRGRDMLDGADNNDPVMVRFDGHVQSGEETIARGAVLVRKGEAA